MENDLLKAFIEQCNANILLHGEENPLLYEVCFFKIYVKFECLVSTLFEMYAVGESSSLGYSPKRKLNFEDREHFNAVLRKNDKQYNCIDKIQYLSQHILRENPFEILYNDCNNHDLFDKMIALRNYIAHESPESRQKYQRCCLSNGVYIEPHIFLKKIHKNLHKSYYTIFVQTLSNVSDYLIGNKPN